MTSLLIVIIYLAFISLGLPDGLLGSAWPVMYGEFDVPVSYAGIVSTIICVGTIISSLQSDRLTRKLGAGKVTALSVATTVIALFGFASSHSFLAVCLWALPYGLGAGCVDAALNNYVALHYESHHMSWLHCMWGLGATVGPYIMGWVLTGGHAWNLGYRYVEIIQIVLTGILIFSLPLWKGRTVQNQDGEEVEMESKALSLSEIIRIPGAKEIMVTFFCYCGLEQTAGLWASSYLVLQRGIDVETAARFASLFYLGITIGRGICGFITMKLNDRQMIRLGFGMIGIGIAILILPLGESIALAGLVMVGLGCAPVYPCIIHSTPEHFGAENSQAIIGVQMASAYIGSATLPPFFGLIANHIHPGLYPFYLAIVLILMAVMHTKLCKIKAKS